MTFTRSLLLVALLCLAAFALPARAAETAPTAPAVPAAPAAAPAAPDKSDTVLAEHVLGNPSAPVTIIEYASLTCGHCAHFHKEILPEVVKKYIATGKVKILFRDFPLNALALKAAQLAQCLPEDRYFPFVKTVFENLEGWSASTDPEATLTQYAKLAGLPGERINACLADKDILNALVKRRTQAEAQYKIDGTPSFVVNYGQETFSGVSSFEDFDKVLKKYVK